MRTLITFALALSCLAACQNNLDHPKPPKQRVDIPLTDAERSIVNQGNRFAYHLCRTVHAGKEKPGDNLIISPLSASLAFSMLNNGAEGTTRTEIQNVLGFEAFSKEELNSYYKKMLDAAAELDPGVTIESANSIWIRDGFPVKAPFADVNKQYFSAEVRNVNFGDAKTLGLINDWAEEKTHGKITDFLDKLDADTKLLLMNALYFLGDWTKPFDKANTKDKPFTNRGGTKSTVPMMYHPGFQTSYGETDQFALATFPYGNEAFYMTVILPHEGVSLSSVVETLDNGTVDQCMRQSYRMVITEMPRFTIEFEMDMIGYLKSMGMNAPFDPTEADFSAISDNALVVDMVKQKAFIAVDEKGTEAAAVTGIGMVESAGIEPLPPKEFKINRPFLYMIREISSGAIYFMGEVNTL